ncbi:MAG: hypothetical protein V1856_03290 [Candidatus Liptonbacteria bacterium]
MRHRDGFMVFEVLVVVVIVAVITAVVFLRADREGGKSVIETGQDAVQGAREAGRLMEQQGAKQQNAIENLVP